VRACVHACVRVRVRASMSAFVSACVLLKFSFSQMQFVSSCRKSQWTFQARHANYKVARKRKCWRAARRSKRVNTLTNTEHTCFFAGAFLRRRSTFSALFKRPHDDDAAGGGGGGAGVGRAVEDSPGTDFN